MKTVKYLNTFAVGLPIALLLSYPIIKEAAIFLSLVSTMLTGFIQFILGLYLSIINYKIRYIRVYLISVILFFILWIINDSLGYLYLLNIVLYSTPIILATYLSILIFAKGK